MKSLLKLAALFGILSLLCITGFLLWGASLEQLLDARTCAALFAESRAYGWLLGIGLLVADLFLPIPASGVMAALGSTYGFWAGMLYSLIGSFLAGCCGYYLARCWGEAAVRRLASTEERRRFHHLFERWGPLAIIGSRLLPVLPGVLTVAAGLARMHQIRFLAALLLGSLVPATLFAMVGAFARDVPLAGMFFATLIPLAFWPLVRKTMAVPVPDNAAQRPD